MSNILEPIGYKNDSEQDGTRYSGGAYSKTHSAVKGYFYVLFGLPSLLFTNDKYSSSHAKNHLLSNAIQFTPHSDAQINVAEEKGLGGTTSNFITGVTGTTDFSLTFRERFGSPVYRAISLWASYMNPYLGASTVAKQFSGDEYKGICMVIQTKPVARGKNLEANTTEWTKDDLLQVYIYDGVFPTINPSSAFDSSIEDNSLMQLNVPFKFDGTPLSIVTDGIADQAVQVLNNMEVFNKTAKKYTDLLAKAQNIPSGSK